MRCLLALLALLPSLALGVEPLGLFAVPSEHATALAPLQLMVEGGTPEVLHVHGTQSDRATLDSLGIPYSVLTTDITSLRPAPGTGPRDAEYHAPAAMAASLRELAAQYPGIARVVDVGTSWEGRELTGLLLTADPSVRELSRPSYRILGTHHGDEWSSMEVAWSVAWALADGYGTDARSTLLLDTSEVWIVPVVNPDGVEAFTRRNSRMVDLNRNYSFEWASQSWSGAAPFSERETDAMRLLARQRAFGHSLSLHSGATNFGWVWNWTLGPAEDDSVLEEMAQRYLAGTGDPDFWITNGAAWYITYGDTNDWSYGVRGGHDYTVELSDVKAPPEDELEQYLDWHTDPSIDFLVDGVQSGVRGGVLLQGGTRGLEAVVTSDLAPWPLYTDPETGGFSRPFGAGTHTLTVSAAGFQTTTATATVGPVGDGATLTTVFLTPVSTMDITGAAGLSTPVDVPGTATLCGTGALAHAGASGTFALHRPGLGTHPIGSSIVSGAEPCVALELDAEAIPNAWDRVGEWSLLFLDDAADAVASKQLAVLFASPDHTAVTAVETADEPGGTVLVSVHGPALPEGALLRFVGPDAQRWLPVERLVDAGGGTSGVATLTARVDLTDWMDGEYSIRVFGGGEFFALENSLQLDAGLLTATYVPPVGDDDDDDDDDDVTTDDDDDNDDDDVADDDDATEPADPDPSGCTACGDDSGSGTLALLALTLPLSLRRRRTL